MEKTPNGSPQPTAGGDTWSDNDHAFIRVIEDLLETLIERDIIALSDLPLPAQNKIRERRERRHSIEGIIAEDEKIEY